MGDEDGEFVATFKRFSGIRLVIFLGKWILPIYFLSEPAFCVSQRLIFTGYNDVTFGKAIFNIKAAFFLIAPISHLEDAPFIFNAESEKSISVWVCEGE